MKTILTIITLMFTTVCYSQLTVKASLPGLPKISATAKLPNLKTTYDLDKKQPKDKEQQIGTSVITTSNAIYKKESYPVYSTAKGKLFIVYPNKERTGYSKKYIPKDYK